MTGIRVRAHAKINLDLRIFGTRVDGFHELRTVFQSISLHDTLTCVSRPGPFAIECEADGLPLDHTNLIWRAADRLWRALRRTGEARDVVVTLDKRIPQQAGLGGGSADAAAALVALSRLWRTEVRAEQLTDIAATLGADVPFFLAGGTALGLGRGDEIHALADLPRHWVVLLIPGFGVSSGDAYRWYDAGRAPGAAVNREPRFTAAPWSSSLAAQMVNDLEAPVARQHPEISQMRAALRRAGAVAASMTGSGSTVFGLFDRRHDAQAALKRLAGSGWDAVLTESLGRAEHERSTSPRVARV